MRKFIKLVTDKSLKITLFTGKGEFLFFYERRLSFDISAIGAKPRR